MNICRTLLPAIALVAFACARDSVETNAAGDFILRDVNCKSCNVVAESVAFLGHPDDTLSLRMGSSPTVDSHGNFYLGDASGGAVLVLRPNGRLMTMFGSRGQGPGEFLGASRVFVGKGDTLYVQTVSWIHVLSPQHQHLRQFQNPRPVQGAGGMFAFIGTILSDNRVLLSSRPNGMVIIDSSGVASPYIELAGFDSSAGPCGDCGPRGFREGNKPGSIWSAPHNSYRVEQHDLSGKLLQRFIRMADWYPDWEVAQLRNSEDPISFFAKPRVWGVLEGKDGIIWTHTLQLEDAESFRATWVMGSPRSPQELMARLSTRIEAIDVSRKRLLGGIKLSGPVLPMTGDLTAHLIFDADGGFAWKVLRLRVDGNR